MNLKIIILASPSILIIHTPITQHPCNPILLKGQVGHQETTNNLCTQVYLAYVSAQMISTWALLILFPVCDCELVLI